MNKAEAFAIDFAGTEPGMQHLLSLTANLLALYTYQTLPAMIRVML